MWDHKTRSVSRLWLDPSNPRLAVLSGSHSQSDLLAELIQHEDVKGIAKSIAKHGYFSAEVPVVTQEDSKTVVIEGNRRVAALKLLLDPSRAPQQHRRWFQKLADGAAAEIPEKITVAIAESRRDVVLYQVERHTKSPTKPWNRAMYRAFQVALLREQGYEPGDVRLTDATAAQAHLEAALYQVLPALPVASDVATKTSNPRTFPLSTLARIASSKSGRKLLKLETSDEHGFVTWMSQERFEAALTRVVEDLARGDQDSRSLNADASIDGYLRSLGLAGGRRAKAATPAAAFIDRASVETPRPARKRTRTRAVKKTKRTKLVPPGFPCDVANDRIEKIFDELKGLKLVDFENAIGVLFRTLLDCGVSHYLREGGHHAQLRRDLAAAKTKKGGTPRRRNVHPTLNEMLTWIENNSPADVDARVLQAIRNFKTKSAKSLCLEDLNQIVHNEYVAPGADELRRTWDSLDALLRLVLSPVLEE